MPPKWQLVMQQKLHLKQVCAQWRFMLKDQAQEGKLPSGRLTNLASRFHAFWTLHQFLTMDAGHPNAEGFKTHCV